MESIVPCGLFYLCIRSLPVDGKTISALTAKNVAERKTGFTRRYKGCSKNTLRAGGRFFERSLERKGEA